MSKEYVEYLRHILIECEFISLAITEETLRDNFLQDEVMKRAVVRSLEIIGEATKKIPVDVKLSWNNIAWKNMAGMRDRLFTIIWGLTTS
ncbi:uncharacterized protein with HEPN domain [Dyadobacter arcticus]|uniref:Uncharacterized protein with HEPN domain n=1 Tax=Dyadobacter arcticus TaxID=1078754 RepID=A0ABX0USF0_9BACT|nr:HepT-like ribonuclease domain-containing protein [Dyadobacter arcticus]NIJ55139.1 uncharacterized protein with HEPN domain [Dyadobacter arcticus]